MSKKAAQTGDTTPETAADDSLELEKQVSTALKPKAKAAGPLRKYRLREKVGQYRLGLHYHVAHGDDNALLAGEGQAITAVQPGQTVTTSRDLMKLEPDRWEDLGEAEASAAVEDEEAVAGAVSVDSKANRSRTVQTLSDNVTTSEGADPLGTDLVDPSAGPVDLSDAQDVTAKFSKAKAGGLKVLRKKDDYFVTQDGETPLNDVPLGKDDVNVFVQTHAEQA